MTERGGTEAMTDEEQLRASRAELLATVWGMRSDNLSIEDAVAKSACYVAAIAGAERYLESRSDRSDRDLDLRTLRRCERLSGLLTGVLVEVYGENEVKRFLTAAGAYEAVNEVYGGREPC